MAESQARRPLLPLLEEYHNHVAQRRYLTNGNHETPYNLGMENFASAVHTAFLPEDYPDSVSPDYVAFQAWDTVQALSSYIRGLLTSQAVLRGVGVGQQAATPLAAVFLFFMRDLAGMLGGILFAFWQGSSFDTCAKQWRLFADVANDLGMTVDLASPFFPSIFIPLACFGSVARAVTGVAGGATRAALTQHFALKGNAADVSAKESSQETATTLIGMVLGMVFTRLTSDHAVAAWSLFIFLTIVHIWANIHALQCLVLTTINVPRLEVLLSRYISDSGKPLPTPAQMPTIESLIPPPLRPFLTALNPRSWGKPAAQPRVSFGVSFTHVLQVLGWDLEVYVSKVKGAANRGQPYILGAKGSHVYVVVHRDHVSSADLLRAYTHGLLLGAFLCTSFTTGGTTTTTNNNNNINNNKNNSTAPSQATAGPAAPVQDKVQAAEAAAAEWMRHAYPLFLEACAKQGWDTQSVLMKPPKHLVRYAIKLKDN